MPRFADFISYDNLRKLPQEFKRVFEQSKQKQSVFRGPIPAPNPATLKQATAELLGDDSLAEREGSGAD